jgi:hypothetical protein
VDPNSLKTGTAPNKPVALHDFKAVDHTGSEFTLEQLKVSLSVHTKCMHT